ncbi:MAG TPA: carboxypeptidase-like regulatory domain-containing protein [Casimicrobiaceae bacterium]
MRTIKLAIAWSFGVALALPVAIAVAQSSMPDERILGDVTYVSGGAAAAEANALRDAASRYPLAIEMRSRDALPGDYVADAQVGIRDAQGNTVFNTVVDGPILLAKLPPGVYTVVARWKGTLIQQTVDLTRPATQQVRLEFAR